MVFWEWVLVKVVCLSSVLKTIFISQFFFVFLFSFKFQQFLSPDFNILINISFAKVFGVHFLCLSEVSDCVTKWLRDITTNSRNDNFATTIEWHNDCAHNDQATKRRLRYGHYKRFWWYFDVLVILLRSNWLRSHFDI